MALYIKWCLTAHTSTTVILTYRYLHQLIVSDCNFLHVYATIIFFYMGVELYILFVEVFSWFFADLVEVWDLLVYMCV